MPDRNLARTRRVVVDPIPNPSRSTDHPEGAPGRPASGPAGGTDQGAAAENPDLQQQLAGADAEADALRHDLDVLRRLLDEPLPPITPVARRSHRPGRRAALGALVVGGTLGIVATGVLVPWSDLRPTGGPATEARPSPLSPLDPTGPFTANPGSPGAEAQVPVSDAPAPREAPAGALPATGPGIDQPGSAQAVTIGPDGAVTVVEQAVLGPRGQRGLTLTLPSVTRLGGSVAELTPAVADLRVAVNGTPVTATPAGAGTWTVETGAARARTVALSYRLTGSVLRSPGSEPGRALVVSLPLLGQTLREQNLPVVVRATGDNVRGVTCPAAPTAQMLCGVQDPTGWTATIPAAATAPVTLLQVDLQG